MLNTWWSDVLNIRVSYYIVKAGYLEMKSLAQTA